jgi:hypothetical protein
MKANEIGIQKAIDELYRLREERKILLMKEEQLSDAIKDHMLRGGIESIETKEHCALITVRAGGALDPESVLELLRGNMEKFLAIVSVRKTGDKNKGIKGADYYLSKEDIESITEYSEIVALKISKLAEIPEEEPKAKTTSKTKKVRYA